MASPLGLTLAMRPPVPSPAPLNIQPTNVAQIYQNAYTDQMAQYQANLARQNAMWGGLASIGGTLAGLPMGGGTSLGGKLVGSLFPSGGGTGTVASGVAGGLPTEAGVSPAFSGYNVTGMGLGPATNIAGGTGSDLLAGSAGADVLGGAGADALGAGAADAAATGAAAGGADLASMLPFLLLA